MRLFRLRERSFEKHSVHAALGVFLLLAIVFAFVARGASAQSFEVMAHATILHTGNSISLSGQSNANGPGTATSGHTLISLDTTALDDVPSNPANPWFAGTTANYLLDGSAGVLNVPAQSTILHAELIWGGSYNYGAENLTTTLDDGVTFETPTGASSAIIPDPSWSSTLDQFSASGATVRYYVRAADVTTLVALGGDGIYKVGGVPVTQAESINSLNGGGWALVVIAENAQAPCRSLALKSVGQSVDESAAPTVAFSLSTPASGPIAGRAVLGAIAGDASRAGDSVIILAPGASTYLALSGPNNPQNNFFGSQINDSNGLLDTSGTFGTRNHNAVGATQSIGGRQGWDLTAITLDSASGMLAPAQVASALRFTTTGDEYVATFAGFEADSVGPCAAPPGDGIFANGFESLPPDELD